MLTLYHDTLFNDPSHDLMFSIQCITNVTVEELATYLYKSNFLWDLQKLESDFYKKK